MLEAADRVVAVGMEFSGSHTRPSASHFEEALTQGLPHREFNWYSSTAMRHGSLTLQALLAFSLCLLLGVSCSSDPDDTDNDAATSGGSDGSGTGGSASPGGAGGQGGEAPDVPRTKIGDVVFDEDQVQSFYLTFSDAEYAKLMDFSTLLEDPVTVNEDRYVEAKLEFGEHELPSIGVRIKGNYSVWGCVDIATGERVERVEPFFGDIDVCQRFSLKLDFNRFDDRRRLDGLKKLNLQSMSADPSKMRDRLAYSLYRDMDIVAPRAVHTRVYINGQYHGLFAAVEQIDGRFTAKHYPDAGDGNVYKQLWPSERATTTKIEDALRTNDDPERLDVSDFVSFKDAVDRATEANFEETIAPFIDLDQLARFIVVDRAINDYDSIMAFYFGPGWGPDNQNYYWYNAESGLFTLIPWDFDKAFWYPEPNFWSDNRPNGSNVVPNWNVITDGCDGYASNFDSTLVVNGVTQEAAYRLREIDCDPFLRLLRGVIYERQKGIADAFIAGPFSEENVTLKLEAWRSQIEEAIEEDPLVDSTKWHEAVDNLLADLPHFQSNLSLMMNGLIEE